MNPTDTFQNTIQTWIGVAMHNSMLNLTRYARQHGFSISQLMALHFVSRKAPCSISDLGDRMGVTSAAASQLLDRLVQQGLVLRTEDPNDRRGKLVELTAEGQQVFEESHRARQGWLADLEEALSPEERKTALAAFHLLIEKAKNLEQPAAFESGEPLHT
jgi:DNA-binding MarR family transcriptional regulator